MFGHAHGHSPAWQSSVPTIAPRVPATFSRRRGLRRLPGEGSLERRVCLPPLSAEEYLPIIHLVFANLKTWLNGIHHGVSHQHLQAYLNEFTFRFNKRFYPFNAFRSLLGIAGDVTAPYLRTYTVRWPDRTLTVASTAASCCGWAAGVNVDPRGARLWRASLHEPSLYSVLSIWIATMKQSSASVAELRGGGAILSTALQP